MKKLFVLSILSCALMVQFTPVFSQAVGKGNLIIDPYYGFPNFRKYYTNTLGDIFTENGLYQSQKASSIGPMGLRAEFLLADRFGIGFDFIYTNFRNQSTVIEQEYNDQTGEWNDVTSTNDFTMNRIRFQVRINYHFQVNDPDLDVYFGLGAGTNNKYTKRTVNGNIVTTQALDGIVAFPMSMRVCSGVRYYFTENIGFNLEIGLGGPILSAGVSFKI
jgi:opacity protein-like surface antigen